MIPEITNNIDKIIEVCKVHYIKNMYVFGSSLRDDFNAKSDVDFLYEFDATKVSIDNKKSVTNYADNYFDLKFELENILNKDVDLIENKSFKNPYFNAEINKTKVLLYAAS